MRAAEIIRAELDHIVAEWANAARSQLSGRAEMPPLVLLDHVPGFLGELAQALEEPHERFVASGLHAEARLGQEFDVEQVVHEYRVLRNVLSRRIGHELSTEERTRVDEVMDHAVAQAVARYARVREQSLVAEAERFRLALDAAALGFWEWFPKTGHLSWDDRTRQLFGVGTDAPITFDLFMSCVRPDDRERVAAIVDEKTRSDASGDDFRIDFWAVRTQRCIASRGRVLERAPDHTATRVIGTILDETDRKRTEEGLRRTAEIRERFIAILSHDLRNPLGAIRMAAMLMVKSEELPPSVARLVGRIVSNTDRMGRMIGELLDLTRGRLGGGIPIQPRPTSLREIAPGILENMDLTRPGRQVIAEARGDLDGFWDPDRLSQVLSNLVANALDHGEPTTPVRVELLGDEPDCVSIAVRNAGTPIPADELPHVFEPFRRGCDDRKTAGLGLGLYIAREIARSHGGDITVTSSADEGTTFRVTLPRRCEAQVSAEAPSALH